MSTIPAESSNIAYQTLFLCCWLYWIIGLDLMLMELPSPEPGEIKKPDSLLSEFHLRTDRLYEDYLDQLSLSETQIKDAGLIVDAGSGFASFVEVANQRYQQYGTHALGIDIEYQHMTGTQGKLDEFTTNGGLFTPGYGKLERNNNSNDYELRDNVYKDMYDEVTQSGNYLAGSFNALPLADETVGLLIAHNSILQPSFGLEGLKALPEIKRVLKPTGEARLTPSYFSWDNDTNEVSCTPTYMSHEDPGLAIYRKAHILAEFLALQESGAQLWLTTITYNEDTDAYSETLIITRDSHKPSLDCLIGSNKFYKYEGKTKYFKTGLAKFEISKTPQGYSIYSTTEPEEQT